MKQKKKLETKNWKWWKAHKLFKSFLQDTKWTARSLSLAELKSHWVHWNLRFAADPGRQLPVDDVISWFPGLSGFLSFPRGPSTLDGLGSLPDRSGKSAVEGFWRSRPLDFRSRGSSVSDVSVPSIAATNVGGFNFWRQCYEAFTSSYYKIWYNKSIFKLNLSHNTGWIKTTLRCNSFKMLSTLADKH